MKRLVTRFRQEDKGFTMLELLVVIAILAIMAAVVVPNVGGMLGAGNLAASNIEAANVRMAVMTYYADNTSWPASSDDLPPEYLNAEPDGTYTFGVNGLITTGTSGTGITNGLNFNAVTQQWERP